MFNLHPEIKQDSSYIPVSILDTDFSHIIFTVGRVKFIEVNDGLTLNFNYDIVSGELLESKKLEFETLVGNHIIEEITKKLEAKEDIVYKGGEGGVMFDDEDIDDIED